MKRHLLLFSIAIISFNTIFGQSRKDIKNDALEARDEKMGIFIQLNDGQVQKFKELEIKHPIMAYEYLQGDGKRLDIAADSIAAFQTDKFYALRIFSSLKVIGKLPFTELFAQRIRNGKIELFMISEMSNSAYGANSSGYVWSYYIRKSKSGKVMQLNKENLKSLIVDNQDLLERFDKLYRKGNLYKSATTIIDEYN